MAIKHKFILSILLAFAFLISFTSAADLYSCGTLSSANTIYYLQDDLPSVSGDCFIITADNITLDFNGKAVIQSFPPAFGVKAVNVNNITIKNYFLSGFANAIHFDGVNNSRVQDGLVAYGMFGYYIMNSHNNTFSAAYVDSGDGGASAYYLDNSDNNNILNAYITLSGIGIILIASDNNYFYNPTVYQNAQAAWQAITTSKNNTLVNPYFVANVITPNILSVGNGTNIIFQNSDGKIEFDGTAGYSEDSDVDNNMWTITNKYASVETDIITSFNRTSNVTFNNVVAAGRKLLNTTIYKNGALCTTCGMINDSSNVKFNVTSWSNYTIQSNCGSITSAGYYVLDRDLNAPVSTCIPSVVSNSVIDGLGYKISYNGTNVRGIITTGTNVTIKNINLNQTASSGDGYAIWFNGASGNIVDNANITTLGANAFGVRILNSAMRNIIKNSYIKTGSNTPSIIMDTLCHNTTIIDNKFEGTGYISVSSSNNMTLLRNNITTPGVSAITLSYDNHTIRDNNINSALTGVNVISGSNSLIENNFFNTSGNTFRISSASSSNITFKNNTLTNNNQLQLYHVQSGTNNTYLINQNILNYSFLNSKLIIENQYGVINFTSSITQNGTNLNTGSNADIIQGINFAFINSTRSPGLNVTANITLYTSIPPKWDSDIRIERDGVRCDATTTPACYNFTALNLAIVKFNVTSWSNYSLNGNDTIAPTIDWVAPTLPSGTEFIYPPNANWTMNATAYDLDFANLTYYEYIDGVLSSTIVRYVPRVSAVYGTKGVGVYSYNITACDTSNNCNSSSTITITVIEPPPVENPACRSWLSGYASFFSSASTIFTILGLAVIIGVLIFLVAAANGDVKIDVTRINELFTDFPIKEVIIIITAIVLIAYVGLITMGILC